MTPKLKILWAAGSVLLLLLSGCASAGSEGSDGSTDAGAATEQGDASADEGTEAAAGTSTASADCDVDYPDNYKVGFVMALTGSGALAGETAKSGADLAIEHINSSDVLGGATMELAVGDHQALPAVAVSALEQLISVDDIPVSVTGFSSPAVAQAPVAERHKVLAINAGAQTPLLAGLSDWLINTMPLTSLQLEVVLGHAANELGAQTFGMLHSDDDLGRASAEVFQETVENLGGEIVGIESFLPDATDYAPAISNIKGANPDAVLLIHTIGAQMGNVIRQAANMDYTPQWLSYAGISYPENIELGGDAIEGLVYADLSTLDPETGEERDAYAEFRTAYEEKYGDPPEYVAAKFYEAYHLIARAISDLQAACQEVNGENLRDTIIGMEDFSGIYGPLDFQADGTITQAMDLRAVENSEFTVVQTYSAEEVEALR